MTAYAFHDGRLDPDLWHCWHGQGHPEKADPVCCRCKGAPCGASKALEPSPADAQAEASNTQTSTQPKADGS